MRMWHLRKFRSVNGLPLWFNSIVDGGWDWIFGDEIAIGEFDLARDTALDCLTPSPGAIDTIGRCGGDDRG